MHMARRKKVYIQPDRARHTGRKLAKKCVPGININSLPYPGLQQSAFQRSFARVTGSQERLELVIPLRHKVYAALLDPSIEIVGSYFVVEIKDYILRRQYLYRGLFHAHALTAKLRGIRRVLAGVESIHVKIILHQQGAALAHKIKQALIILSYIFASIVGAYPENDRAILIQIPVRQFVGANQPGIQAKLLQRRQDFVTRAFYIADL